MNKRNGLSHTKIMPAVAPESRTSEQIPVRPGDTRLYPIRREMQQRTRQQQATNRAARQQSQRTVQPQRQRITPAEPPIRRASYQDRLPEADQSAHRRPEKHWAAEYAEERTPELSKKSKKKHKKRRHGCIYRTVTGLLTAIILLFGLYSAAAVLAIHKIDYEPTGARNLTASGLAEEDTSVRNILIIGTDSRGDERGRADTMIVLSFSKHNKTVTMSSLLRDTYVSIPNHGTDKLNAAYAYGGATLLMDTIVNNFGIPLDDYVCVNFKAFVHIADALGGVKLTISDREAEAINVILESEVNGIMGDEMTSDFLPSGGTFVMNGKQALSYARIRHVGNADFERTERQRTVLNLMLNKLKHISPTAIPKILYGAMPELSTNISGTDMYLLSLEMPAKLIAYDMQQLRLPSDGTFSDSIAPDGQMVLAADFDRNHQLYLDAVKNPRQQSDSENEVQP